MDPNDPFGQTPQPTPAYPPPPGNYAPYPMAQPRPAGSNAWKFLLAGCGCLVLVLVVGCAGFSYWAYNKGPSFLAELVEMGKPTYMAELTSDHTDEQKARFEQALDRFIEEIRGTRSYQEYANKPINALFQELQNLQMDQKITVEESQMWADHVDNVLGESPETEEDQ